MLSICARLQTLLYCSVATHITLGKEERIQPVRLGRGTISVMLGSQVS